eukprot:SAG22_NODE_17250_length_308_cov_1.464115_1_plen_74_part_10
MSSCSSISPYKGQQELVNAYPIPSHSHVLSAPVATDLDKVDREKQRDELANHGHAVKFVRARPLRTSVLHFVAK